MRNGHKVFVFAASTDDQPPTLILSFEVPLTAMTAISPVIALALTMHNKRSDKSPVNNVILPPGSIHAYKEFLHWILAVVDNGQLIPLRALKSKPLTTYSDIIKIATKLKVVYLAVGLRRRIDSLLRPSAERQLTLHPGDVREIVVQFLDGHWLRKMLVNAIATAEMMGNVHPSFEVKLSDLYGEVRGLGAEVEEQKGYLK